MPHSQYSTTHQFVAIDLHNPSSESMFKGSFFEYTKSML